jgi:tartrate-resistant acid phosphatase type 5
MKITLKRSLILIASLLIAYVLVLGCQSQLNTPSKLPNQATLNPPSSENDGNQIDSVINLTQSSIRFAVIGDFGQAGPDEADVANLVKSWEPDFIATTGDNNYPNGSLATIDNNIGQYYHEFISAYPGNYGSSTIQNRFFPTLGNHDWRSLRCSANSCTGPYLDYFSLPGNERYYDFVWGPVHFFMLDSDGKEPDGTGSDSQQARWLQSQLQTSESPWNLVFLHHSPFSSSLNHGSDSKLQWPYQEWGVSAVIAGHNHNYERLFVDGLTYFVNGLGGKSIYDFGTPLPGSQVRFNQDFGAMLIQTDQTKMVFQFTTRNGELIDSYTLENNP